MIVLFEEIGARGLAIDRELTPEFLRGVLQADNAPTGFAPSAPGSLHARFEKVSGKILLTATGRVQLQSECKRCLVPTKLEVPLEFTLSLVRRQPEPSESEERSERRAEKGGHRTEEPVASFEVQSVEEEPFDGRQIDLGGIVREQILLALPMDAPLCREDCKGLCPACGKDLNQAECGCDRTPKDPRWAALESLKLK